MTTETGAPAAEQPAAPVELPDEISLEDARSIIDGWDDPEKNQNIEGQEPEAEGAKPATAKNDPSKAEDLDPETDPEEIETEANDPEDENLPSIERPRSWAKELDEEWASYPRAAQERIAKREQERDTAVRRGQNELAEQRKAVEADREAVKALRQQYETRLPDLTKTLEAALQNDFGDIRDLNDVRKLQMEDPFRFQQWQLRQMELAAAQKEQSEAETKRNQERNVELSRFMENEGKKFNDALSDKDKANLKELMADAPKFLEDRGFTNQELTDLWQGKDRLSLHDHRLQLLILDGMKFRNLQNAPKAVATKTLPPVQKPGSSNRQSAADADISTLERRLAQTGSEEDGWKLLEARMKRAR